MLTLTAIAKVDEAGRLTIDVPTSLPAGDLKVELHVAKPADPPDGTNIAAILRLSGTLKWKGDPMDLQRKMRNEWPD